MRLSKELKYNIVFAILLMVVSVTWEYSNDIIFNQSTDMWFKPASIVLFTTMHITYFSVYAINYLIFAPRFLKPNKIIEYCLSFVFMVFCFAGIRFLFEEVLLLALFDFHNYNLDRPNIVAIYLTDSAVYTIRPCLFSSLMFLFFRFNENKSKMHQIQLQHQDAQMAMLRSQISPHFLFNTLNGFYSDLYEDKPKTAEDILKLSHLLRYVTYDAKENYMPLDKEIAFIKDYLYFYRKRYEHEFYVDFRIKGKIEGQKIPALMLIHFVENLCKHGIINDADQPATIEVNINQHSLEIKTENAVDPSENYMDKGIGTKNINKRLKLLFGEQFTLYSKTQNNIYQSYLKLPL
ncbi:histidine kinase [uncultured Winogradskyella sp.]|uniref:sensor histidine kinase n=1 Tax=uncultured Winogradskyella sp. TaxID=395353 RepID=UPI002624A3D9|nr:histidine kinase [uncultured Winogradskyella sp.]